MIYFVDVKDPLSKSQVGHEASSAGLGGGGGVLLKYQV